MSIEDEITARIAEGRLIEFETTPPMSKYRLVYLTPELNTRIVGPWEDDDPDRIHMPEVRADLENFIVNGKITTTYRKYPNTNFKRLQDRSKQVWEIRTMDPNPGSRMTGFFVLTDRFIGTDLMPRDEIDFDLEINRAKACWRTLFTNYQPVVSENIHDYISTNVVHFRK